MKRAILLAWTIVAVGTPCPVGAAPGTLRMYSALEMLAIDNQRNEKGQKLPEEYIPRLREEVLHAIGNLHLFRRIDDQVDTSVSQSQAERVLQIKVKITDYSGAQNNARVSALVTLTDKEAKTQVLEKKVDARLYYDPGAMTAATRKLAHSISNLIRDNW